MLFHHQDAAQRAAARLGETSNADQHSMSTIRGMIAEKAKDGAKKVIQAGLAVIHQPQTDFVDQDVRDLLTPLKTQIERTTASVKLEQMSRSSMVFSLTALYFSSFFCLAAAIIVAVISSGIEVTPDTVNASLLIEGICRTLAVAIVSFQFIFFPFRVFRFHSLTKQPIQQEQLLLIAFLFLLMVTPAMSVYSPHLFWEQYRWAQVNGPLLYENNPFNFTLSESIIIAFFAQDLGEDADRNSAVVMTSICTVLVIGFWILYFGLTCHYFGISAVVDLPPLRPGSRDVTATATERMVNVQQGCLQAIKSLLLHAHRGILLTALSYAGMFITLVRVYNFVPSQVPFVGIISVLKTCITMELDPCNPSKHRGIGFQRAMVVMAQFIAEAIIFWSLHRVSRDTAFKLKTIPYETSRAKHLGFKFFNSNKRMMYFFVFLCSVIVTACSGVVVGNFDSTDDLVITLNPFKQVGITFYTMGFGSFYLLLASFLFSFAYAYLPPDSRDGLGGFLFGGKKRTSANDAPVYLAKMSDVRIVRETKLMLLLEEERGDSAARLRRESAHASAATWPAAARMVRLPALHSDQVRKALRVHLAPPLHRLARFMNLEEGSADSAEEETLERRLANASDACYQVNANFFCLETEVLLLNFSYMAYCSEAEVRRYLPVDKPYRFVEKIENVDTEIQCYVVCDDVNARIFVFFRGTSTKTNVWQDINYFQIPPLIKPEDVDPLFDTLDLFQQASAMTQKPLVHRGFYRAYLSVRDRVLDCVSELIEAHSAKQEFPTSIAEEEEDVEAQQQQDMIGSGAMTIFSCGHSLGGALATHFAADIALKYRGATDKFGGVQLTTFGSPRVGNFAYTSRVARLVPTIHRFCIGGDPVPKLPPSQYLGSLTYYGFQHVGVEILLDLEKYNLLIEPLFIEKQIQHAWRGYVPTHHLLGSYVLALLFWNARVHPDFVPDWWLPIINNLLQFEKESVEAAKRANPSFTPNIMDQLEKEGAIFWTADMRSFQNRGCDTRIGEEMEAEEAVLSAERGLEREELNAFLERFAVLGHNSRLSVLSMMKEGGEGSEDKISGGGSGLGSPLGKTISGGAVTTM